MARAAVHSGAVVLLLLISCLMCFSLFVGGGILIVCLCFCYSLLCVHSSFEIILNRKRIVAVLILLSYRCIGTINVL